MSLNYKHELYPYIYENKVKYIHFQITVLSVLYHASRVNGAENM